MASYRELSKNPMFHDGEMFPVYTAEGSRADVVAIFVILERYAKETKDNSHLRWFPHILVSQSVLIQEYRADLMNLEMWEPEGEPRILKIALEDESKSLPFVSRIQD